VDGATHPVGDATRDKLLVRREFDVRMEAARYLTERIHR
jgi:hypothetical protein